MTWSGLQYWVEERAYANYLTGMLGYLPLPSTIQPATDGNHYPLAVLANVDLTPMARNSVRNATLSDLLNGKADLSPEMVLRIELAFDVNAEMLRRM